MQKLKSPTLAVPWNTGSGSSMIFSEIISLILQNPDCQVHVGTDSQIKSDKVNYAIAICITNPSSGGRYFFKKISERKFRVMSLGARLHKEVSHSIDIAQKIIGFIDISRVSIHIDINDSPKYASSKFTTGLTNYVKSMGYECFIKPYSWASFSVADKHTK